MSWIDIAVVGTACLCGLYGLWKGIVRTIAGVVGLLGALLLAGAYHRQLGFVLWPTGGIWANAIAYTIILVGTLVVTALVATGLARLVHMTPLGIVDRVLGLTAGLLVTLLGWGLIFSIMVTAVPGADTLLTNSMFASRLMALLAAAHSLSLNGGITQ